MELLEYVCPLRPITGRRLLTQARDSFQLIFLLAAVARASKAKNWLGKDPSKPDVQGEARFRAAVTDVGQLGFRDLPNAVGKLGG